MCLKIKALLDSDHAPVLAGSASKCKPFILDFHSKGEHWKVKTSKVKVVQAEQNQKIKDITWFFCWKKYEKCKWNINRESENERAFPLSVLLSDCWPWWRRVGRYKMKIGKKWSESWITQGKWKWNKNRESESDNTLQDPHALQVPLSVLPRDCWPRWRRVGRPPLDHHCLLMACTSSSCFSKHRNVCLLEEC